MSTAVIHVGRVLRVGRGWADVEIDHRVRRVSTRPELLVRAGGYLKIMNERAIAVLPSNEYHTSAKIQ